MAPGRVESNETLDRIEDTMSRSTTRTVGPLSLTVCSPPSRRVAALRPRYAGLTALTPAARTVDRPLLPDRAGTGFLYRLLLTPNTPIFVASRLHAPREILVRGRRDLSDRGEDLGEPGSPVPTRVVTGFILLPGRLHAPREILVRGRRDLSDRGEDLGEPGSPVPTRVVTGFIPIQGRDADQQPHGSSSASNGTQGQATLSHRHWRQAPRIDPFRSDTRKKGGHALTC